MSFSAWWERAGWGNVLPHDSPGKFVAREAWEAASKQAVNLVESFRMDTVMSKYATQEECKAARDALAKAAEVIRRCAEHSDAASERQE